MEARYTISNMQYENNSFFDRVRYLWKGRGEFVRQLADEKLVTINQYL